MLTDLEPHLDAQRGTAPARPADAPVASGLAPPVPEWGLDLDGVPRNPDDDSFLLPVGDASELDDLEGEVTLASLDRAAQDRMDKMEACAQLDVLVRILRGHRLVGWVARVNPGAAEALIRLAPKQPHVPTRWLAELPESVALDLSERGPRAPHFRWLTPEAGDAVTFSLGANDTGVPQALAVRAAKGADLDALP